MDNIGALFSLAAYGEQNIYQEKRYAKSYKSIKLLLEKETEINFNDDVDIILPLYISFEVLDDMEIRDFYNLIKEKTLSITVNTQKYCLDYYFLINLYSIIKISKNFLIKLPFENLFGSIPYLLSKITIDCGFTNVNILNLSIIIENTLLDIKQRLYLKNCSSWKNLNIKEIKINNLTNTNFSQHNYMLDFDNIKNKYGFFIFFDQSTFNFYIDYNGKTYSSSESNFVKINDYTYFFSFGGKKYNGEKILLEDPVKAIKNNKEIKLYIDSIVNVKIYELFSEIFVRKDKLILNYSKFFGLNNNDDRILLHKCLIGDKEIIIEEIFGIKVHNYKNNTIYNIFLKEYPNCKILKFNQDSDIDYKLINITNNFCTIIYDNVNYVHNNLGLTVKEIWFINSPLINNFPIGLEKIILVGKKLNYNSKIPLNCIVEKFN